MKKLLVISAVMVIAFAGLASAEKGHGNHMGCDEMKPDGNKCGMECYSLFHGKNSTVKLEETKAGVKIIIYSDDKKAAKQIKEDAKKWHEKHRKLMKSKRGAEEGMFVCPVMGTKMKVADAHSYYEYKGKTYYFCCAGCPEKFKADPEKYIK